MGRKLDELEVGRTLDEWCTLCHYDYATEDRGQDSELVQRLAAAGVTEIVLGVLGPSARVLPRVQNYLRVVQYLSHASRGGWHVLHYCHLDASLPEALKYLPPVRRAVGVAEHGEDLDVALATKHSIGDDACVLTQR